MEKSLALVLPDRPGALREVMRILSAHGVDALRVSYNRVVDVHALFLDVSGTMAGLEEMMRDLRAWRFLPGQREVAEVRLLEFDLDGRMDVLEQLLALMQRHELNVTYVDVRTDGLDGGSARVAVCVTDQRQLAVLLHDANELCETRLIKRGERPNMLDNNHFILSFAHGLASRLKLSFDEEEEILINSNRVMQNLVSEDADPYKPFDYIDQVAEYIAAYRGSAFAANTRITRLMTAGGVSCVCIEPPIGSDTWIFECDECLLCVDCGQCCYASELEGILRDLYPDWDERTKKLVLTHADFDHVGACHLFDEVYASGRVIDNFMFESMGIVNWREQNPLAYPYNRIGGVLSGYRTPAYERMICLGEPSAMGEQQELLRRIDTLEVAPLRFEVWEGKGGHVRGETLLIERTHKLCLSGDVFVNVHGQTKPQSRYNTLGPYLMTSVDTNPELARQEREELFGLLGEGTWQVMGGHGAVYVLKA